MKDHEITEDVLLGLDIFGPSDAIIMNHECELNPIPFSLLSKKLNNVGFYWLESGLFDLLGVEITVPQQ